MCRLSRDAEYLLNVSDGEPYSGTCQFAIADTTAGFEIRLTDSYTFARFVDAETNRRFTPVRSRQQVATSLVKKLTKGEVMWRKKKGGHRAAFLKHKSG